ncbi:MAG: hypothetical protein J6R23_06965 [Spirochaetales bacterium]|nr:hypothetical protein [Spirochaetales bacterium]
MENNETLEYFLTLLDEAESLIKSDYLREESEINDYSLTAKQSEVLAVLTDKEDVSSCHICPLYKNRRIYAEPIYSQMPKILFIAPFPEGDAILTPAAHDYFSKWYKAIHLERKDIALTTLIKCPSPLFTPDYANMCKKHVKEEMTAMRPKAMVLLGEDAARYMLRRQEDFDQIRQRRWIVNGIPVYCTYHPEDLVRNNSIKRAIWDDLQYIARELAL